MHVSSLLTSDEGDEDVLVSDNVKEDTRWHRNRLALWWVVIMGVVMLAVVIFAGIFKGDTPGPGDDIEMSLNRSAANHSNGMIQLWGRPSRRRRPTFAPTRRRRPTFVPTRRRRPQRYHRHVPLWAIVKKSCGRLVCKCLVKLAKQLLWVNGHWVEQLMYVPADDHSGFEH